MTAPESIPKRKQTRKRDTPRDRITVRINRELVEVEAALDADKDGVQPDVSHTVRVLIGEAIEARLAARQRPSQRRR